MRHADGRVGLVDVLAARARSAVGIDPEVGRIDLDRIYRSYGFPNDMLVHLNVWNARVRDVPSRPVYGVGETSGIKIRRVVPRISWLLVKGFFWRMREKYVIRDFHPLVFFYAFGFLAMFTIGETPWSDAQRAAIAEETAIGAQRRGDRARLHRRLRLGGVQHFAIRHGRLVHGLRRRRHGRIATRSALIRDG